MNSTRHMLVLVEDSLDDEEMSLRAISKSGVPCEVQVLRHGGDAVKLFSDPAFRPPDLVVLDFRLPGFNGLEILRQLRKNEKFRQMPIVMLSSLDSDADVSSCLREGANSCVQKATDPAVYSDRIVMILKYWLTIDSRPGRLNEN